MRGRGLILEAQTCSNIGLAIEPLISRTTIEAFNEFQYKGLSFLVESYLGQLR